jgi:hypothetical protein
MIYHFSTPPLIFAALRKGFAELQGREREECFKNKEIELAREVNR